MLKIKDNVDLKKLEKYGFDIEQLKDEYEQIYGFNSSLSFYKDSRVIFLSYNNQDKGLITLYDLISDGLVEKVEE